MNHNITIQPADTPEAEARFRHQLTLYFRRDIFPGESPETALPPGYWQNIDALHRRAENPLHYLFFRRDGVEIGLTMTVLYLTEDQKQFILEFCVYPAFRGNGTGTACAEALLQWGRERGAAFFELNAEDPRRVRFWSRLGFRPNGRNQSGPLMLLPPDEKIPFTVSALTDTGELWDLESSFLAETRKPPLEPDTFDRLADAIDTGKILFLAVRRLNRPVGICSVSPFYLASAGSAAAMLDNLYVEPCFRRQGAARALVQAARDWCRQKGCRNLFAGCPDGGTGLCAALEFTARPGQIWEMTL